MNERIQELAEQCYHRYSEYNINLEKFAELLIKECAKICEHNAIYLTHMSLKSDGDDGIFLARADESDECAVLIKEHFGIEE